jgi:DNA-binding transcriptional LysR family regulator
MPTSANRPYEDITYQQLRSFCETVRLGSFTAAAQALGLAHPTVWTQVHVLERELGEKLVEPCGRGCRVTEAGRVLAELAAPAVAGIATLKHAFRQARAQAPAQVVVGAQPRAVVEDLPECVEAFTRQQSNARLVLREFHHEGICQAVETGEVDLGFVADAFLPVSADGGSNPRLEWEVCYQLDVYLVTPRNHPLARRRRLTPEHLRAYPLVNAPDAIRDRAIAAQMEKLGLFSLRTCPVEVWLASAIRNYVAKGFGIGLICSLPPCVPHPLLHERNLSHLFGRSPIYLLRRKGAALSSAARRFIETVKACLGERREQAPR